MKLAAVAVSVMMVVGGVLAQGLTFDAASIDVNAPGEPGQRMNTYPGRLCSGMGWQRPLRH